MRKQEEWRKSMRVAGSYDDEKGMLLWIQQDVSLCLGQILFSPLSLPTNGIWIYFSWTCGCTSLLLNPLSIWEKCNIIPVRPRDVWYSKILLTSHYETYMIDLQDVGIKMTIALAVKPIRDRCSDDRPRRLRMQMLIAEFVLSHIMHRTASGSRRRNFRQTRRTVGNAWQTIR